MEKDEVREYLNNQDISKSMDPDGMHPQVLKELAGVTRKSQVSLNDDNYWERCLKNQIPILYSRAKSSTQRRTSQSASPQSLGRFWKKQSWKPFPGTWRTRRSSGIVSIDSPRESHV